MDDGPANLRRRGLSARTLRSPYFLAWLGLAALVVVAWTQRDRLGPVMPGRTAPDFTFPDLRGNEISLSDHSGQVVIVNIWATWCFPCRAEMPSMQRMYDRYRDHGLEILGISVDAGIGVDDGFGHIGGDVGMFVDSIGVTFPILLDPEGDIQQRYGTFGVPESFVIDRDGMVRRHVAGATVWETQQHVELIEELLAMNDR